MKTVMMSILMLGCLIFFAGCPLQNGGKPQPQKALSEQQKIDAEVAKVQLNVPKKASITAEELIQENITASGYDDSIYAIVYKGIKPNNDKKEAEITFYLTKGALVSKDRTVTVIGFKEKPAAPQEPTAQEKINAEVDKVQLDVPNKAEMSAGELTEKHISAQGYDTSVYAIAYKDIKTDSMKRKAEITFYLVKETLKSKERTVTVIDFKEKPAASQEPTAQEKINAEVDKVVLDVPNKADISVSALADNIIVAAEYNSAIYAIVYKNIKTDDEKREAQITFYLTQGTLTSKERTVTVTGFKAKPAASQEPTAQEKINAEVDKVVLDVPNKAEILAGELKQENISASGYDSSYAIKYEKIEGNTAERNAEITFFLKKDGITSKPRTIIITGFKAKPAASQEPSAQEKINAEVDKVEIDAKNKAEITADQLTSEHLIFSAYDTAYTVHCKTIKSDINKKEAEVTFYLTKEALTSKDRTVTVIGFKAKPEEPPAPQLPQTMDIQEGDLLELFHLTETKIPASAAAKKIAAAQGKTVESFAFEEAHAIAYDDKTGTFTVKVKGTKNGKAFENTISVTGFANPYAKIFPSFSAAELDFSSAIENNTELDAFIEQANTAITTVLKKLSFNDNTTGTLSLGAYDHYSLAAALEKTGDKGDKIEIRPEYTVHHFKKEAGGSETVSDEDYRSAFSRLKNKLTKPYFSKNDVFMYLLGKTDNNFLKVYPDTFASKHYAFTKHLNRTPGGVGTLLDDAVIQDIIDRYKNDGGHFKMEIVPSVYKPRVDGIKADDYTGSLEIKYCIAEAAQIEAMLDGGDMPYPIVAIKEAKRTGFRTVTKANAETLFNFQIKLTTHAQAQNAWKQKQLRNHPLLRAEYDSNLKKDVYKVNDPFKKAAAYYTVTVNGKEAEDVFALDNPKFFSKCADGTDIFIEQISLNKEIGSDKLNIHIKFTGEGEGISIEKQPE